MATWHCPFDADAEGVTLRWRRDLAESDKSALYRKALATFTSYEEKAALCKRPEEVDPHWLYAPVWSAVNRHYAHLGLDAHSFPELIEQLGILRYGHRPRVGDTFCGGGSIPFEAARLGCDVYASDLNPIACMLTWGALNIIGASPERRAEIEQAQRAVARAVDREVTALGIEHDEQGNRAKAYLYCLETRCPETGWRVPMSPSWVISKTRNVIARLVPDHDNRRFDIEVISGVSDAQMRSAEKGTVRDGALVYELDGKTYRTPIKTLRGDYRDADGNSANRLRRWEKHDFKPRPDDIFQERLMPFNGSEGEHWTVHAPKPSSPPSPKLTFSGSEKSNRSSRRIWPTGSGRVWCPIWRLSRVLKLHALVESAAGPIGIICLMPGSYCFLLKRKKLRATLENLHFP